MRKFIFIMFLFLTACGTSTGANTPTATPNPGEIALQMMQQQVSANATSQVVGLNFTATAQVVGATATANQLIVEGQRTEQARVDAASTSEQHRADAQATSEQHRSDVQATQARMDMDAQATQAYQAMQATQARDDVNAKQARIDAQSTADSLATATYTVMTLTAIPPHATLTQMAVNNQIVVSTQEVERSALSLKQQRDTNVIQWLIPTIIAIFLAIVGAFYIYNQSRIREVRDEDGTIQVVIVDNKTMTVPALLAGPVLDLVTNQMPMLSSPKEQSEVTRRAQAIRALGVMPVQPTASGAGAFNDAFSIPRKRDEAFEIVEGEQMPPIDLMDAEALKATEQDWKDANDK
jgi:flagellar motor protein MotB